MTPVQLMDRCARGCRVCMGERRRGCCKGRCSPHLAMQGFEAMAGNPRGTVDALLAVQEKIQ
ncbi:hypothetical protein PTE31013_00922 [Pandoraea terrigena]|uniref:Uncharacterized protein n=1 Tax=Pandoraea terrigena TaxID=2508292 RepID=A0A5E4SNK0_9BURK|nr:hypothetical protein PTE31013_00922 [Pandoraea terrigena]